MKIKETIKSMVATRKPIFGMGLEREMLRVTKKGTLATSLHPKAFGIKLDNYSIKTDFAESQPELVTKVWDSVESAMKELEEITLQVAEEIAKNEEVIWNQSMPCILPEEEQILTAIHPGDFAKPLRDYLDMVRKKYGAKKQLICGIHYNVSFSDSFLQELARRNGAEKQKDFVNGIYMKILRNYVRYSWVVLYMTGASPAFHESFLGNQDGVVLSKEAVSMRMSPIGYHNTKKADMDYSSVEQYCKSIETAIETRVLMDQGELFAPIKMKAKNNVALLETLRAEGILYLELRNIDINPFEDFGVSKTDLDLLNLFLLYLLYKDEEAELSVEEALENALRVAEHGLADSCKIRMNGIECEAFKVYENILEELRAFHHEVGLYEQGFVDEQIERLRNKKLLYATRAYNSINSEGFIKPNCKTLG